MIEPISRAYVVRRGDVWVGETFRFLSATGASFWSSVAVRSQIRTTSTATAIAHEFSVSPVVTTEGANGVLTFTLSMTSVQSEALAPGSYVGDIEISSTQLPKSTLVAFSFDVVSDVTRN